MSSSSRRRSRISANTRNTGTAGIDMDTPNGEISNGLCTSTVACRISRMTAAMAGAHIGILASVLGMENPAAESKTSANTCSTEGVLMISST